MSPAVIAALLQLLSTLGPAALQAIEVLLKAQHQLPLTAADHVVLAKAVHAALPKNVAVAMQAP
jgi:hypothetical protein